MRRNVYKTIISVLCIVCLVFVIALGLLGAAEMPWLIWKSKQSMAVQVQDGASIAQIVADHSAALTPYYLNITTDKSNHRVYSVCYYHNFHFEDNYLIKRIDVSTDSIEEAWYWGETKALHEVFPHSLVGYDPDFYERLLSTIALAEDNDKNWIYCYGFVFTSDDGINYSLEHEF